MNRRLKREEGMEKRAGGGEIADKLPRADARRAHGTLVCPVRFPPRKKGRVEAAWIRSGAYPGGRELFSQFRSGLLRRRPVATDVPEQAVPPGRVWGTAMRDAPHGNLVAALHGLRRRRGEQPETAVSIAARRSPDVGLWLRRRSSSRNNSLIFSDDRSKPHRLVRTGVRVLSRAGGGGVAGPASDLAPPGAPPLAL